MSTLSSDAIEERIRCFAESVRKGMFDFKPGKSWWIVKQTGESEASYKNAILITEQLGLSENDMRVHLKSYWSGNLGSNCYTQYFRQAKIKKFTLVTVTMEVGNRTFSN